MSSQPATSATFLQAFNLQTRNTLKAIQLYTKEVTELNPLNYVAWNNMGCCKIHVGKETKNIGLIKEGKSDIERSLTIASSEKNPYYFGKTNLEWAKEEIAKLGEGEAIFKEDRSTLTVSRSASCHQE